MLKMDIVNWLRDPKNNVPDRTAVEALENFREVIAGQFFLHPQNPEISSAFKFFVELKRPFNVVQEQPALCKDEVDDSWVKLSDRFYWATLRKFLKEKKKWNEESLLLLDDSSESILKRLAPPHSHKQYRGMVIGYVQSGKTASMTAVMAKAADHGYKIFIILAGTLNNLRQQTQLRFIQELIGTKDGTLGGRPTVIPDAAMGVRPWQKLTDADPKNDKTGDVENTFVSGFSFHDQYGPLIAVIKKNASRMEKLKKRLKELSADYGDYPCLILDDESDAASINTSKNPEKVTSTNKAIRELFNQFKNVTYVGYTATPYANVFIDYNRPNGQDTLGADLFPEDFISLLKKPPGYFGATDIFGLVTQKEVPGIGDDEDDLFDIREGLPIFGEFVQQKDCEMSAIEGAESIEDVPTLKKALNCFILSCAARMVRNQESEDMSMLINPGVLRGQHKKLNALVFEYRQKVKNLVDKNDDVIFAVFHALWNSEFLDHVTRGLSKVKESLKTRNETSAEGFKYDLTAYQEIEFSKLRNYIVDVFAKLEIKVINSESDSILQYGEKANPKRYIVIGGNKLSRGLTLEGLSVSYFIRNPQVPCYDTLMQMGRWFGYRNGYIDLCRIWAHEDVIQNFAQVAMADEDLRKTIERDYKTLKPRELPPRVFKFSGMQITSKMGAAVRLSNSGARLEETRANFNSSIVKERNEKFQEFLGTLGDAEVLHDYCTILFQRRLKTIEVRQLLEKWEVRKIDLSLLSNLETRGENVDWLVCLAGGMKNMSSLASIDVAGRSFELIKVKRGVKRFGSKELGFRVISEERHFDHIEKKVGSLERVGVLALYVVDGVKDGKLVDGKFPLSKDEIESISSDIPYLLMPSLKMPVTSPLAGGDYYGQQPREEYLEEDED